ncbi:MAG TPA: hypothetical protein VEJ84_11785 [Acidimicrobiales bacterium]|nr:hypothetical protein [Acidimicrobiales bacterium]
MSTDTVAIAAPLVGVVLGWVGSLATARSAQRRADRERASALLAQVFRGVSSFGVEVDAFCERRTSPRAQALAFSEAFLDIAAAWRDGTWWRGVAAAAHKVRRWDLTEGDRLLRRLQPTLADLYPALVLLSLISPFIRDACLKLGNEVNSYAALTAKDDRKAATAHISAALGDLRIAVTAFTERRWWQSSSTQHFKVRHKVTPTKRTPEVQALSGPARLLEPSA